MPIVTESIGTIDTA